MTEILLSLFAVIVVIVLINRAGRSQTRRNYNITPLHDAAAHGDAETVTALLRAGNNVNAQTTEGTTPLHGAAFFGNDKTIKTLLEAGANAKATDNHGNTPFDLAKHNDKLQGTDALQRLKNAAQ